MDLKDWASKQSRFIKLGDGESIEAVFIKAIEVDDSFNPGKTKIRYTLEVDNEEKFLESASSDLARKMFNVEEGEVIKISRTGESMNTRYEVKEVVSKAKEEISKEELEEIDKKIK
jgi:hypothetical protein